MLATCSKLRLLSVLLLLSLSMPLLLSSTILVVSKAPAVHGDSIMTGVKNLRALVNQVAAPAPCRKCPNGQADGPLQCNGPMLAIQVVVSHVTGSGLRPFLIPWDKTAARRDIAPDPPPPRFG
ncbi:hypothetical protein [Cohaesibacter intestini]|uniref:hypothetical protein n=1 Tax=Cohaesibacter intestini TaxID=2211145 RepID=UPI000DE86F29|nr:hypothetical protein [Cohaesibacter intestini]